MSMKRKVINMFTAFFCLLSASLWAQTNKALASNTSGWIDILPDESFKGWTRVAIPPDKALDPVSQWKLDKAHRIIICEGDRGHEWLRYDRELADLILHVEWRFTKREGLKGYNSGVFIRNSADGRVWHQAQVGAGNDGYLFGQTLADGKLTEIKFGPKPKANHIKPPGEWNIYEVRCQGPKITLWVNGELSSEFAAPEVLKGYLGLEAEGFLIEFRNLKFKLLP
jgi:hypothetical protein